ncbi:MULTISPECIES: universal stress protein [unclassified Microbacterium]|uniref:universal stress protein n=1 Tax=unclassified Microbacterium TaxID=2609290 RepID=UPI000CFF8410|nr:MULTISPECIES: universal stress protein [unclassified Microbacterium]PRB65270.1 universal stress protein UspA [Microbacterium sp. MYb45]
MEESILVGVVDSRASQRAVEWAARRAEERLSRVELISVVGGAIGAVGEGNVVAEAIGLTRALLAREAERVRAHGVKADIRVARGNPVEELIDASMVFDLLVIGSDFQGSDTESRRGPHGIRVAAGAHCPVVVVPDIDLSGRRGVVVGVDGSSISRKLIDFAAAEAAITGDPLTVVNAWVTVPLPLNMSAYPADYLRGMQKLTEDALAESLAAIPRLHPQLEVRRVVERGYAEVIINRLASDARLAVIGSHGRGAIARFLLGSTSQAIVSRPSTVTVIVR